MNASMEFTSFKHCKHLAAELSCNICLETFTEPATLHCGHSFCRPCLVELYHRCALAEREATCPTCRRRFRAIPERSIVLNNTLQLLGRAEPQQEAPMLPIVKWHMPRSWPNLQPTDAQQVAAFNKQLKSQRTMRKRALDSGHDANPYDTKISKILKDAWQLHASLSE